MIVGIALVAALVALLGLSRPLRFDSAAEAARAYLHDWPEDAAALAQARVILSDDGAGALIALPDALGVVTALGDGAVTRRFAPGEARARADAGGVAIITGEIGAPRLRLAFAQALAATGRRAEALAAIRRMGELAEP